MRIAFFGTPEFAAFQLEYLLEQKYTVVAVITAEDKPAGRGKALKISAVKETALRYGLNLLQPANLKSETFVATYEALNIDCAVVVAFRMLPEVIWRKAKMGTFNLHASLLPDYRGAAPIQWAIRNGEHLTGLTTFLIDDQIDTGSILLQESTSIAPDDNAETLHDKLMRLGAPLIEKTLIGLAEQSLVPKVQPQAQKEKHAPKLTKENTLIDLDLSAKQFVDLIRSLTPYPGAKAILKEGNHDFAIKIGAAHPAPSKKLNKHQVTIEGSRVFLGLKDDSVELLAWQFPSKRMTSVKDFLNGHEFKAPVFIFNAP